MNSPLEVSARTWHFQKQSWPPITYNRILQLNRYCVSHLCCLSKYIMHSLAFPPKYFSQFTSKGFSLSNWLQTGMQGRPIQWRDVKEDSTPATCSILKARNSSSADEWTWQSNMQYASVIEVLARCRHQSDESPSGDTWRCGRR